jgi:hypothetical protein
MQKKNSKRPKSKPMEETILIETKNPASRWVAVDINNKVISEGETAEAVEESAKKITEVFFLMFVPQDGVRYIF